MDKAQFSSNPSWYARYDDQKLNAYAKAGAEEMFLQWTLLDDIEGLQVFVEDVLPYIENYQDEIRKSETPYKRPIVQQNVGAIGVLTKI